MSTFSGEPQNGAIQRSMDLRRYELAPFAASRQHRSTYCSLAHEQVLLDRFVDTDQLRALTDADVIDVVLIAAARCFPSKTLDALGVLPDPHYRNFDPELMNQLTVGRPIEESFLQG